MRVRGGLRMRHAPAANPCAVARLRPVEEQRSVDCRERGGTPVIPAVLLMGPTGSGKSALALALAERFRVEIVSVDSAQVYRGMDIGTAKPDAAARARVPHHLIDIIDPVEAYSAARFRADAIARDRRHPLARRRFRCWSAGRCSTSRRCRRAFPRCPPPIPPCAPASMRVPRRKAGRRCTPSSRASIPRRPRRLEPTDAQRIQRALEVYAISGRPLSGLQGAREGDGGPGRTIAVALVPGDRAALHRGDRRPVRRDAGGGSRRRGRRRCARAMR